MPARDAQHRRADAPVASAHVGPIPPGAARRMPEPVEVVRRRRPELRHVGQRHPVRQRPLQALPLGARLAARPRPRQSAFHPRVRGDVVPDPGQPRQVPGAPGVEEVARRRKGHRRHHRLQVRRRLDRREPLDGAGVREPVGADLPGRPGLSGGPLDGVVAVGALVAVRREPAAGVVTAPDVDQDDGIAGLQGRRHDVVFGRALPVVRGAVHERREAALGRGAPDVRGELHTVAHGHGDSAQVGRDLSGRRNEAGERGEERAEELQGAGVRAAGGAVETRTGVRPACRRGGMR